MLHRRRDRTERGFDARQALALHILHHGLHGDIEAAASSLEDVADEGALPHMFDDTILHLRRAGISNSIKRLTELSRQSGLTPAQQEELHRLLKEKAGT